MCYIIIFYLKDKMFHYKLLAMGLKQELGRLNSILTSFCLHTPCKSHTRWPNCENPQRTTRWWIDWYSNAVSWRSKYHPQPQEIYVWEAEDTFIGLNGLSPDPDKVNVQKELGKTKNKEDLNSFVIKNRVYSQFCKEFRPC